MQKVTAILPSWDKTKTGSKKGFDTAWRWADKLGAPINRWTNKIGSEAFWPTTLDLESDKAARILRSFCKDGFYHEDEKASSTVEVKGQQRVLKKIPETVIKDAVGLAIFTTMRTGLWVSGAGGSGVLVARKEDGNWSPPSGILVHTTGLGFLVGVDIYDCVLVINNRKALESFTHVRATLGGELSAVAGPMGVGGLLENDGQWKQANRPVFTYLKSRGLYAGVQVDGTIVVERTDENERFFGQRIGVADILAGNARHPPYEIKMLMETLKAAEGSSDVDTQLLEELLDQPAPGDVEVSSPTTDGGPLFGVPEAYDPDPFGVHALEKIGLEIREAGTHSRPPSTQFEFHPSPTSPVYGKYHKRDRHSIDTTSSYGRRESFMSHRTRASIASIDRSTQTDLGIQKIGEVASVTGASQGDGYQGLQERDEKPRTLEPEEVDYTKIDLGPYSNLNYSQDFDGTTITNSPSLQEPEKEGHVSEDSDVDDEEPIVFEAASAQAAVAPSILRARAGIVTIPARGPPPPLPPRSMARRSNNNSIDSVPGHMLLLSPVSPTNEGFEEVDIHHADVSAPTLLDIEKRAGFAQVRGAFDVDTIEKEQKVEERKLDLTSSEPTPVTIWDDVPLRLADEGLIAPYEKKDLGSADGDADSFHSLPAAGEGVKA